MVAIGVVYLAFQKRILANSGSKIDSIAPAQNRLSRALIGAQVGKALMLAETIANYGADWSNYSGDDYHPIKRNVFAS